MDNNGRISPNNLDKINGILAIILEDLSQKSKPPFKGHSNFQIH